MPIKPENAKRYPKDWKQISDSIRERADYRCECAGECGLHCTNPGPRRCIETQGAYARWANGKIVLTVAHLNHDPADCRPENLKAMCQRCHLRYDREHHQQSAYQTRRKGKAIGDLL